MDPLASYPVGQDAAQLNLLAANNKPVLHAVQVVTLAAEVVQVEQLAIAEQLVLVYKTLLLLLEVVPQALEVSGQIVLLHN
jgi:hypothetical protein